MSSVDERTVKMRFDNAEFKREAIATKASLDQVDAAVAKSGKGRGLLDMAGHMQTVAVKASAMQIAVVTALANVVSRAVDAGLKLGKALTLDPITQGFNEYELKMKSIRTILANTTGENLESVTKYLDDLNKYSDKTIYNFANMTDAIGKMTTAGIELGVATEVVKGFSNMVALAGGDSTAAAGALEQFVYGLQAGKITALDWQSIATRGLGSMSLQKAFFETAKAAGTLGDVPVGQTYEEWTKAVGGFKGSLETGWLTSKVATDALSIMTGDVKSVADLMEQGFSKEAAEDLIDIASKASKAATEVYSFTTFMGTLKEQIGSGWAKVLESVIGDVTESTALFTSWANTTGRILKKMFGYIGNLAEGWAKFGGQSAALKAIQHVLAPIAVILGAIAKGFKAAFGGTETGKGLATFTKFIEKMLRPLNILAKLISGQITPLEAFGRLLQWAGNRGEEAAKFIGKLIEKVLSVAGISLPSDTGIVGFVRDMGREIKKAIDQISDLLAKGESLRDSLGSVDIKLPKLPDMSGLPGLGGNVGGILSGIFGDDAPKIAALTDGFDSLSTSGEKLIEVNKKLRDGPMFNPGAVLDSSRVSDASDSVGAAIEDITSQAEDVETVGDKMGGTLDMLKEKFLGFIKGFSFEDLTASFNLAVITTTMISFSKFMNTMSDSFKGFVGTGEAVNGLLEGAGGALKSFQTQARAKLILNIAIAIGILAVSLWLLSKIPMEQLLKALGGMAALFVLLDFGLKSMTKAIEAMDGKGTVLKLGSLAVALVALGVAMLLLSTAFLIMNRVKWSSVLKGLLTMRVAMISMMQLGTLAEKSYKNILAGAAAITMIAGAMVVLALALLLFKLVDWESMGKAGLALAAITLSVGALALIPYEGISKVGLALLTASLGLTALAVALILFEKVDWESMKKAGVALLALTVALAILQVVGNPVAVSGMIGIGLGLLAIATACLILNNVEWASIAKAGVILGVLLVAFAALLGIIYLAAPVIPLLVGLGWTLATLALGLGLLAFAVAAILPLMAIGVGAFAAFATGAAVAIAVFLTTLALEAPIIKKALIDMLQVMIDGIVESVPMIIRGFKDLWAAIKAEFTDPKKASLMGDQGKSWMDKLKEKINEKIPELVEKAKQLLLRFINGLIDKSGRIAQRGADLIVNVLNGIASRADQLTEAGANLIIKFLEGIGKQSARIADAAFDVVITFVESLSDTIRTRTPELVEAFAGLGLAVVQGFANGIRNAAHLAWDAAVDLADSLPKWVRKVLGIASPSRVFKKIGEFLVEGLTNGIQDNAVSAINAVASMVSGQISVANEYISSFIQKLDQQALAASAKAAGLAAAAEEASKSADRAAAKADKTKRKGDDKKAKKAGKSADELGEKADKAAKAAEKAEQKAQTQKDKQDRAEEFGNATRLDQAKMRSEDAQSQMDAAKSAEFMAAKNLQEAQALEKQAKAEGVTKKERKALEEKAAKLREQAKQQAKNANDQIKAAKASAADAIALQKQAGDEAAAEFQKQYDEEAQSDKDDADFEKLTDTEKAAKRRDQAAALKTKADEDLAAAKVLAYTDLEAANELAAKALEQADLARQYLTDAEGFDEAAKNGNNTSGAVTGGRVVDVAPTEAAAIAFNKYADLYDEGVAAAAATPSVEFNQYNTSPESLNPIEVYRQTNNIVSHAAQKLQPAA